MRNGMIKIGQPAKKATAPPTKAVPKKVTLYMRFR